MLAKGVREMKIEMNDLSESEKVREYAAYCGPKVLASVLGIEVEDAARKLMSVKIPADGKITNIATIGEVLGLPVHSAARVLSTGYGPGAHVKFSDRFPTLGTWLRENPGRVAILRAGSHFVYVGLGRVLESAGWEPRHARVTHAIVII